MHTIEIEAVEPHWNGRLQVRIRAPRDIPVGPGFETLFDASVRDGQMIATPAKDTDYVIEDRPDGSQAVLIGDVPQRRRVPEELDALQEDYETYCANLRIVTIEYEWGEPRLVVRDVCGMRPGEAEPVLVAAHAVVAAAAAVDHLRATSERWR